MEILSESLFRGFYNNKNKKNSLDYKTSYLHTACIFY